MSTRGDMLDYVVDILGDTSTEFRVFLRKRFNSTLRHFWNLHDFEFTHGVGTFSTVAGTELYDLNSTGIVGVGNNNIRSIHDIEFMYDSTRGNNITKVNLSDIRRSDPRQTSTGTPRYYAPWGQWQLYLKDKPNVVSVIKFLYKKTPTIPAEAGDATDASDMLTIYGLPYHMEPYFEKVFLAEAMLKIDDSRRMALLTENQKIWIPRAVQVDMEHLESNTRFRFWTDILGNTGSFDDFIRSAFYQDVYCNC